MKNKALIALSVFTALTVGFLVGLSFISFKNTPQNSTTPPKENFVNMLIDDGYGNIVTVKEPLEKKQEKLLNFMESVKAKYRLEIIYDDFGSLGRLVVSMLGRKNGSGGRFWQFWVNHEYAKVGISAYDIKPGDFIDWKFSLSPSRQNY